MLRKNWSQIESLIFDRIVPWIGAVLIILSAASQVSVFYDWGIKGPFKEIFVFLQTNALILWLSALSIGIVLLWFRTSRLYQRFTVGFSDNFDNLDNWDYRGNWDIPSKGTLIVTGSGDGGITKVGKNWENYTFTFKARIVNKCLGVIFRAQDLYNYYMFQIHEDKIRPHFREVVPVLPSEKVVAEGEEEPPEQQIIKYISKWHHDGTNSGSMFRSIPLKPKLEGWFEVIIEVRGEDASIRIVNETDKQGIEFHRPSFLQIPAGKVGFRNSGLEEAYVKEVQVLLHP